MFRKLIYLNSFVLLLGLVLTSAANAADPDLLGWWKFDGDATDNSGNNHPATLIGDPQWVSGKIGRALEFDGVDDRLEMPGTDPAAGFTFVGEVTWATWVKTPGRTSRSTIICQGPPGAAHVSGNRTLGIEIPGTVTVRANGVGAAANFTSSVAVNDDQWHHVAATIAFETNGTNDTIKVYIDGDLSKGYETNTVDINANMANATDFIMLVGHVTGNASWLPFDGLTDDVRVYSRVLTEDEIREAMKGIGPGLASGPNPADTATDVPRDVALSWAPGEFAATHDVYLGTVFNDVNNAGRSDQRGVLASQGQIAATYDPPGRLDLGQTYYWRIDEVNAPPASTIFKGDVWSFTVEPIAYPIDANSITATASSSNSAGEGPENTINGSGLNANDLHSVGNTDMWLSSMTGAQPTWIQYEFDRVHKLHQMLVWNHNTLIEAAIGFGIKEAAVEYSADGTNWTILGTTHEFARGTGVAGYAPNTSVDLGGVAAKYVRVTTNSNWGGILNQFGLSEVRFLSIPVLAQKPNPASGATDIGVDATLSWRAGREAAKHNVYLSTDEQAVIDGTAPVVTVTSPSYTSSLDLAGTYYWRIDEVNDVETPTTWQGDIWSLSTQEYLVVDDFDAYNDIEAGQEGSNLVYVTWTDGFEKPSVNGSTIGYTEAFQPSMEKTLFYDGSQSVPLSYNNTTATLSEVTANVVDLQAGRDWTRHGIKALTLRFFGDPNNNVQQMYVKINGSKVTYDGDAENIRLKGWQMWYIDLTSLGVNLGNVTQLTIGFERIGTLGGQGMVLLDGLRLYSYDRQLITAVDPGTAGLQAQYAFEGNSNDSSGKGRNGTAMGGPLFVAGQVGQAISFDGIDDYVNIDGYKGILADANGVQQPFTITAWVRTTDSGDRTIASWGTNTNMLRVDFRLFEGRLRVEHGGGNVQGDTTLNDGNWHHVALTTIRGATISYPDVQLWLDGKDDTRASTDLDPFSITAGVDVAIGYRATAAARYFLGVIDDVRLYDRVLTQEEIAWLASRMLPFDKPF